MAEGRGESQGKGKRKVEYDGSLWPVKKAPSSLNVVYAKSLDDWNSVEEIQIGEHRFPFFFQTKVGRMYSFRSPHSEYGMDLTLRT